LNIDLEDISKVVRAKRGPKLPVVLTVDEVQAVFKEIDGTNLLMLQLLYGAGLRVMELVRLRVQDIDFGSHLIIVRSGKGDKDRSTLLPESIKTDLYMHLERVRALHDKDLQAGYGDVYLPEALARKYPNAGREWGWQYVFPSKNLSVDPRSGKIRRHHMTEKAIQDAMKKAVKRAGIDKHATVHTLRHSFATHLLMSGVNIRKIQDYLGHKNLEATMIYTHVVRDMSADAESPLDMLKKRMKQSKKP
jgi:integron integrase